MVLADTNVWCEFFRRGDALLSRLLDEQQLIMHPLVMGELSMGNLPHRRQTLQDFHNLPSIPAVPDAEVHALLEARSLYGQGLQWNDLHILASVLVAPGTLLWTRDQRLTGVAESMAVSYPNRD